MPYCGNVQALISQLQSSPHRSVIMIDRYGSLHFTWGYFDHPYDMSNLPSTQINFVKMSHCLAAGSDHTVFTDADIPDLNHIGRAKIVVIIRLTPQDIRFINGEITPVSEMMGLE